MQRIILLAILGFALGAPSQRRDDSCTTCILLVDEVRSLVSKQETQDSVLDYVNRACSDFDGDTKDVCRALADQYSGKLFETVADHLTSQQFCQQLGGVCTIEEEEEPVNTVIIEAEEDEKEEEKLVANPIECELCKLAIIAVDRLIKTNKSDEAINSTLEKFCNSLPDSIAPTCKELEPKILEAISNGIDPEAACKIVAICVDQATTPIPCDACLTAMGAVGVQDPHGTCAELNSCAEEVKELPEPLTNIVIDKEKTQKKETIEDTLECELCKFAVVSIDKLVGENKTAATINATLYEVCNDLPGEVKKVCTDVEPELLKAILGGIDPSVACDFLKICHDSTGYMSQSSDFILCDMCKKIGQDGIKMCNQMTDICKDASLKLSDTVSPIPEAMDIGDDAKCELCKYAITLLDVVVQGNDSIAKINSTLFEVCKSLPASLQPLCGTLIPQIDKIVAEGLDPTNSCIAANFCTEQHAAEVPEPSLPSSGGNCIFICWRVLPEKNTENLQVGVYDTTDEISGQRNISQHIVCPEPYNINIPETTVAKTSLFQCFAEDDDGMKAQAYDLDRPPLASQEVNITVFVIYNQAPFFIADPYVTGLQENSISGSFVYQPTASDRDTLAPLNTLRYSIIGDDTAPNYFGINSTTGEVSLISSVNFDSLASYRLRLQVNDGGIPSLYDTALLTISVNRNPFAPVFDPQNYERTIDEDQVLNEEIVREVATDRDTYSPYDTVRYEIVSSQPNNAQTYFAVNPIDGSVYARRSLREDNFDTPRFQETNHGKREAGSEKHHVSVENTIVPVYIIRQPSGPSFFDQEINGTDFKRNQDQTLNIRSANEVKKFHGDVEETKDRIYEKLQALNNESYGHEHEGLERDLAALADKVQDLDDTAKRLMMTHPDQEESIYEHQTEINAMLNELTAMAMNQTNNSTSKDKDTHLNAIVTIQVNRKLNPPSFLDPENNGTDIKRNQDQNMLTSLSESPDSVREMSSAKNEIKEFASGGFTLLTCDECNTAVEKALPGNAVEKLAPTLCRDSCHHLSRRSIADQMEYWQSQAAELQQFVSDDDKTDASFLGCEVCKIVVRLVDEIAGQNATVSTVNSTMREICNRLTGKQLADICLQEAPKLIAFMNNGIEPTPVCQAASMCDKEANDEVEDTPDVYVDDAPNLYSILYDKGIKANDKVNEPKDLKCDLCKELVKVVDSTLENNATDEKINQTLNSVCSGLPNEVFKDICYNLIPDIMKTVDNGLDPDQACSLAKLCSETTWKKMEEKKESEEPNLDDEPNALECDLCKELVQFVDSRLQDNATVGKINQTLYQVCSAIPEDQLKTKCLQQIPAIMAAIEKGGWDPETVCEAAGLCTGGLDKDKKKRTEKLIKFSQTEEEKLENLTDLKCEICKAVVDEIDTVLGENKTIDQINATAYGLCERLSGSFQDLCLNAAPQIVKAISEGADYQLVCGTIGLCPKTRQDNDEKKSSGKLIKISQTEMKKQATLKCEICEAIVDEIDTVFSENKTLGQINGTVYGLCNRLSGSLKDICLQAAPQVVNAISHGVDYKLVCGIIGLCPKTQQDTVPVVEEVEEVMKSLPCDACVKTVQLLYNDMDGDYPKIKPTLSALCNNLPAQYQAMCEVFVGSDNGLLFKQFLEQIHPEVLCDAVSCQ